VTQFSPFNSKPGLGITYVKLDRRCPRCHAHRYHSAHRSKPGTKHLVTVTCAECGHGWLGKFRKDEWSDSVS
jgi:ribosomal protein L37E